ncbi:hypothetical protein OESDEN_16103 [Oesophagostomum dentatum]|uniref:Integrase catalytic domain-containing protein n=1 Tax=Oesophagostomum dentatum TaxID=61180 RepID=A0A0B1SL13_OESDE|nr:hypothetical protein OESDEN_16103 [Oesophagostomum dentatum]
MLRRFFARRGVPLSITSDNAPTFTLGESILVDCLRNIRNDPEISKVVSNHEIDWKYITPYAPWQGGVYERLIKSVKWSLFKSLGRRVPTFEEMLTNIIEVESILNTRPLVYVESGPNADQILRPIDFLQNRFEIPFPLNVKEMDDDDPAFIPAEERVLLQTKMQVVEAIQTSCEMAAMAKAVPDLVT